MLVVNAQSEPRCGVDRFPADLSTGTPHGITKIRSISSPSDEEIEKNAKMQEYSKVLIVALITILSGPKLKDGLEQDAEETKTSQTSTCKFENQRRSSQL